MDMRLKYDKACEKRVAGAVYGAAIGDALAGPFENMSKDDKKKYVHGGVIRGFHDYPADYWESRDSTRTNLPAGSYTDDTQMALATIESLVESGGFNGRHLAQKLASKLTEYRGIGKTSREAFRNILSGKGWGKSGSHSSETDGSAMRVYPIGLFYADNVNFLNEADYITDFAVMSSVMTHQSNEALAACRTIALTSAFALTGDVTDDDWRYIIQPKRGILGMFDIKIRKVFEMQDVNPIDAMESYPKHTLVYHVVPEAIHCFLKYKHDFKAGVLAAANMRGDCDTRASIAGALLGARNGIESIPKKWIEKVESSDYIGKLSKELFDVSKETSGFTKKTRENKAIITLPHKYHTEEMLIHKLRSGAAI